MITRSETGGNGWQGSSGIALILVIVVLMALLLIATPFAVSMKDHKVSVVMADSGNRAHEDLVSVVNAVTGTLARSTHYAVDETPEVDSSEEIEAAANLENVADLDGSRNPRGPIWSAAVEDEQAKLNVNAASPFALANLFGSRTVLSEKIADSDSDIPVEDSSIFDPEGGYVVIGAELVKYSGAQLGSLTGCERGVNAVEEEPARLSVTESYYYSPGCLVRLSDGVRTDYGFISHVTQGFRSILSGRGGSVRITHGFTQPQNHGQGTPVVDARVFAINAYRVLRQPGACYRYPTVTAIRQITELGLPGFDPEQLEKLLPYLTVYSQHEAAARWGNHRSVLNDFTFRDVDWLGYHTRIEYEVRYPINVNTASPVVLRALLVGLSGQRQQEEVTPEMADKLVGRIVTARDEKPLEDSEDFLDRILQPALEEEEIPRGLRGAIFQNFFDSPMLVFLKGGTHRFIFNSLDTFTVHANISRNNAAGVELARRRAREVVSVAPPQLISYQLDSQWDFEKQILPGRYSRFVTTFPVNVETQQSPQDPPVFDPPNRSMKQLQGYARNLRRERRGNEKKQILASREDENEEGDDSGSVRYRPHRSADGFRSMRGTDPTRFPVHHFDNGDRIDGLWLGKGTRTVPLMGGRMSVRGGGGNVSVQVSVRGSRGGGGMDPMVIGLWYQPLWQDAGEGRRYIWGTGENPTSDKVELYYDGRERALVLEVADAGYLNERTLSRCYFPIKLESRTWYHIACMVAGTRPDQLQILVDGVPFRGSQTRENRQHYRFLTRLTSDLSRDETSIAVENTEHFPNYGVLLIGEERIEYRGKSKTSFNAIQDSRQRPLVKRGRGSRGSQAVTHREGAAVMLYGYASAIASEIPAVTGRLTGAGGSSGLGRWYPALLAGKDPMVTVRGAPLGLADTSTTIPLYAPTGQLEGFQQSGYALLLSALVQRQGPEPSPQNPNPAGTVEIGGVELIHYQTLAGTELQGVTRGVRTPFLEQTFSDGQASLLNPMVPKGFLNGTEQQLQIQAENGAAVIPTWVIPVSLQVSDTKGYLDPMKTNYGERVQINTQGGRPEWVRYDEILTQGSGRYFARTGWTDLRRLFNRITRRALVPPSSGQWTASAASTPPAAVPGAAQPVADPIVPGAGLALAPDPGPQPTPEPAAVPGAAAQEQVTWLGPVDAAEVARGARNWLQFRGTDDTRDRTHANNTEVLQVFRTDLAAAGPDDRITLVDASGQQKEQHYVRWSAAGAEANHGRTRRTANFAGFRQNVARRWVSDTERLRSQGQRGRSGRAGRVRTGPDRTPSQINWDTRRVARLLKAPSGELPSRTTGRLVVGGTFGGRRAGCVVDEVETFSHTNRGSTVRRIVAPPSLKLRYENAINPATTQQGQQQQQKQQASAPRFIGADQVNIPLAYANVWTDFDGITKEREYWRGSFSSFRRQNQRSGNRSGSVRNPFPYTRRSRDDRDCGVVRIGDEFIVYRGIDQKPEAMQVILTNCTRGAFGTEPAAHEQGEAALFVSYMEMTVLRGGVSGDDAVIPVENTRGLAPQGYVAVFDDVANGSVREIIGYSEARGASRRNDTGAELRMPQRVDAQQMKELIQAHSNGEEQDPGRGGAGIFRGRFGTLGAGHAAGAVLLRLPFRYWDRAAERADNPELGYFQFPLNRAGAFFKTLTWGERFRKKHLDLRVLARVDQRASWSATPGGKKNGLFEFRNPRGKNDPNRIDMQGNLLEVRVFLEYRDGAFDAFFNADAWKETPWLTRMQVDYVQPNQVLFHEEKR